MPIGGRRREGTKRVKGLSVVSIYNLGQVSVGVNIIQVQIFCQSPFLGHPLSPGSLLVMMTMMIVMLMATMTIIRMIIGQSSSKQYADCVLQDHTLDQNDKTSRMLETGDLHLAKPCLWRDGSAEQGGVGA